MEPEFINENFESVISKSMHERTSITFKTCILFHDIVKPMLLKEILHYFIFRFYVKITKNDNFFIQSWVEFLYIYQIPEKIFVLMKPCKLM